MLRLPPHFIEEKATHICPQKTLADMGHPANSRSLDFAWDDKSILWITSASAAIYGPVAAAEIVSVDFRGLARRRGRIAEALMPINIGPHTSGDVALSGFDSSVEGLTRNCARWRRRIVGRRVGAAGQRQYNERYDEQRQSGHC